MVAAEGHYNVGWHQLRFDASCLASGVYIYRLSTANYSTTRKMMLIK